MVVAKAETKEKVVAKKTATKKPAVQKATSLKKPDATTKKHRQKASC